MKIQKNLEMAEMKGRKERMKMTYDRQKQQQQQFRIEVDANEIVRIKDDEFEGTISATVTRGSKAMSGQQIQIFLAGQSLGNPLKTDENGKVVKDFSITTAAKTISVEAQTVGFATRGKKFIDLPRPEKGKGTKPIKIIPHQSGSDGNYVLTYGVFTAEGLPVAGAIVQIEGANYPNSPVTLDPTDEKGISGKQKIIFEEKELVFSVSVLGSEVSTWINLFNRKGVKR